jgi:hypothetical protein
MTTKFISNIQVVPNSASNLYFKLKVPSCSSKEPFIHKLDVFFAYHESNPFTIVKKDLTCFLPC